MDDKTVAEAREKFNDLQKYVPFMEKFTSCINNNEQSGDEAFDEKRKKCLKLLNIMKNDFKESLRMSLLVNIETTVERLMAQSGDRLTQPKSYKKEPSEHGNQSPGSCSSNHSSLRQTKTETISTSKDRREIRNNYNDDKHRSHNSRQSEYHSRSPDGYRHRSSIDNRRRSPENYRAKRSRSRSSERYSSDYRHRTDFKREDKSNRRDQSFHRDHSHKRERSRDRDYSRDRDKFESKESYSHRSRHDTSYTRDSRDRSRYSDSPLASAYDRSRSKVGSVFDRLEPRTNLSNRPPVKRQKISNDRSRFEPNIDWDVGSPPRKKIDADFSELETLTQNRFGRSKEDDKLSEIIKRQKEAEKLRDELKKQEQIDFANKLLNEIQGSGDYVRKDTTNTVINSLDKREIRKTNESSERQIDRNGAGPNSENSIPSQRIQNRNESNLNKSSSRSQYINPWLNQQSDPRIQNSIESGLHATIPPRVFGEHVTSHGINPLHNNNGNPIVGPPISNEQYPVHREIVPIIAAPQDNHQNANSYSNKSHEHASNQMQTNQRPFNKNPMHNNSPAQLNRKANMKYGEYRQARESLKQTSGSNILVTTTTEPSAKEHPQNKAIPETVTQIDSTADSNKTTEQDTPAKDKSASNDKRTENVPVNSSTNTTAHNKSITKYRIPKLNRSDNSNQSNQSQEPTKEKQKSSKHSNQKHPEKTKEKTPIRNKTKDKDRISADTTTETEQIRKNVSSRNESNVVDSSTPAVEHDDNDDIVSSSTSRPESTGSTALNSSLSDSNEGLNKEKRKAAKTKKNELDRLNDDIRANCNDVVMATGKRACTITSRKGQIEDSIATAVPESDESSSGDSSDEIGKPKAKRKKVIKSKRLVEASSDDSETDSDEISSLRMRPGPKCSTLAKRSMGECMVILERLDEATINQFTQRNEDIKVPFIKNTNPKMIAKDAKECVICKRSYRQLSRHYNSVHEGFEVYCSRMSVDNSNKIRNGRNIPKLIHDKGKPSARCLFCEKQVRKDSITRLIDHFMVHTGEFTKKCTKCGVLIDANTAKTSNCAHTKQRQVNMVQFTDNIYVFMCNICNYAQSQEENIKNHIIKMHEITSNVFEQYKKIVIVMNIGSRRRTNNRESESNDGEISNQDASEPTNQNEDSNEEHSRQIIRDNSSDESSQSVHTATSSRTMADQLHERLSEAINENTMKPETGEDAINVVLRGADEISDNDTENTNHSSDGEYLTGEAIENMYKIEIAKEEIHTSPNVINGKNANNDEEEEWESCSTGSDDDDPANGKFNDKMSTRLTTVSGKSKFSKTKFKSKKRNDHKSIFGTMSCKMETSEEIVNLTNEDDNINVGASTSQQSLGIDGSSKDDGKRIENFAYTEVDTQLKYTCYIGNCNFISLNNSSSFSNHLRKQHTEAWKGFCHSCDKQILNGSFSLMKEFNHMMEIHLPDVNKTYTKPNKSSTNDLALENDTESVAAIEEQIAKPSEPEKPVFRLKLRRLSGDLLSGPAVSQTGLIISNVTSLSETDVKDLDLPVESMEEDIVIDNLVKPWTKCPNTKSAVASDKLVRQISLVALFKCMALDCIFTTSDRKTMLEHLNNHEEFLMQPTNNLSGYTDSDSWLECCYCERILDSCTLLVDHIEQQHSSSIFQCAYCFYRSVDPCNVNSHISFYHTDKYRMVLICGTHRKCLSEEIDILTSKSKNLKRVPCTFPDCDNSFLRLSDLNKHLDQSHEDKKYFHCPFCRMRLSKSEMEGIDLTHFQFHNVGLYHCAYCTDFVTFDPEAMQKHLRDEHPSHLAYAISRCDNGLLNKEFDGSIARAYRSEKYSLCHSLFTLDQINFMMPSLSEYVANSEHVPNNYQDSAQAKANEITFKEMLQLERKTRYHLYKKYRIYTFEQLTTGSWKTSSKPIRDNLDSQLSQNDGPDTFNEITGQMDYITSIQNEIDVSAKELLSETGVPNESIYRCGFTDCHWFGSTMQAMAFLNHLSQHHLIHKSHKCFYCNIELNEPVKLKNHIDATHTTHRYFCFLCNNTEVSEQCMIEHFKNIHKNNFMHFIPLNPAQNDRTKDIFVGCPLNVSFITDFGMKLIERKENKMLTKKYYSPEEVNLLPNRQVFADDVYCKRCNYRTKVRLNMERHLPTCKGSNSGEISSDQAPVNPVNDTGEMHSNKMKNLAASSNLTSDSTTIEKDPSLRYVPEIERFMCGADGCSYRTTASECLQEHLESCHTDQATYYCPHCRTEIVGGVCESIEIINHLRLHSELIFKCSVCAFGHFEKNEVEIHIADVHPKATVQTITRPQKQTEFIKPAAKSTRICKWKCNICANKFNTKILVKQHLNADHQIKYNYQCGLCSTFQDDAKARIKEHLLTAHGQIDASHLKMFFEQVENDKDTSPLWKRDDPTKIKHIRGILIEDELFNVKSTKRKQTWTCDIPSLASETNTQDRFMIIPSKTAADDSALQSDRSRPPPTRQMPQRRASMFVSFSELIPSSSSSSSSSSSLSNQQPPIPTIRVKRLNIEKDPLRVNINENIMPPHAKIYCPQNDSDSNRSSLIYQCNYCPTFNSQLNRLRTHWQHIHKRNNSNDPEAKQFRYRVTVQVQCIHCNITMAFALIWEHLSKMHSNAKFAFAKFNTIPSDDIHCGMCPKKVSNRNDLELHFGNEHASTMNSIAKVQPMPFFNDTIVETLIDQGNHETVKCLYCQEKFICIFDYEQHHQQCHPINVQSYETIENSNIIKYGCMKCQVFSTNRNNIILHIWKEHLQTHYKCLYCPKETQFKKLIKTHHELAHKSNEVRYRNVDAAQYVKSFYPMSMNFPNGLVLLWGNVLKTKFSQVNQLIDYVNELNRAELERYAQSNEALDNDVATAGKIARRRQTYQV